MNCRGISRKLLDNVHCAGCKASTHIPYSVSSLKTENTIIAFMNKIKNFSPLCMCIDKDN